MKKNIISTLLVLLIVLGLTACEETADNNSSRTDTAENSSTESQDLTSESSFDDIDYYSSQDSIDIEKTLIDEYALNDTTDVLTYYIDSENEYIISIDFKDYNNIDENISNFMIILYGSFISEDMDSFTVIATHDNNALMLNSYKNKEPSVLGTFFLDANYEEAYNSAINDDDSQDINENPEPATNKYEAKLISGNYIAGIDFPAGKYDITAVKGRGKVKSNNSQNGGRNVFMGAEQDDRLEKKCKNIDLPYGTRLSTDRVTVEISSKLQHVQVQSLGYQEQLQKSQLLRLYRNKSELYGLT